MEYNDLILTENPSIQFDDLSVPDPNIEYFVSQFAESEGVTHLIKLSTLTDKFPESLDLIKHIIENDPAQINKQSENGWTPLMVVCANAYHPNNECPEVVKMLLDAKCDVNIKNKEGNTALLIAAEHYRSTDNDSYKNIVKMLLDADCDINAQNNYGETALIIAAVMIDEQSKLNSGKELLNMLIDAHCDVNIVDQNGDSALLKACLNYADEEVLDMLIRAGSNINVKNKDDHTPLHKACYIVGAPINKVILLLDNGCNIDAQDKYGFTALMIAISHNSDIAKLLLSANCNVDLRDNDNTTALMYLFMYSNVNDTNHEFVVDLIMRSRKSVNAVDNKGYTAYDYYNDRDIDILDDYTLRILKNEICVNNTKSANRK